MENLNRFALFAGDTYYPRGGWLDFRGSYLSIEDAVAQLFREPYYEGEEGKLLLYDWWHVIDLKSGSIVDAGTSGVYGR